MCGEGPLRRTDLWLRDEANQQGPQREETWSIYPSSVSIPHPHCCCPWGSKQELEGKGASGQVWAEWAGCTGLGRDNQHCTIFISIVTFSNLGIHSCLRNIMHQSFICYFPFNSLCLCRCVHKLMHKWLPSLNLPSSMAR